MADLFMVFDVESIGLHGEGFAVGYVVVNRAGATQEEGLIACDPGEAHGSQHDRRWVQENVPAMPYDRAAPLTVRSTFWHRWQHWKAQGAVLVADCCWPLEARFLAACVDDCRPYRDWAGPYPLHDLASVLLALGRDPLATNERLPNELPAHHPLNDARQSARLLIEALNAGHKCFVAGDRALLSASQPVAGQGWIPVSERLPEVGSEVLMLVAAEVRGESDDGREVAQDVSQVAMGNCMIGAGGPYLSCYVSPFADFEHITHWMPLPPPPSALSQPSSLPSQSALNSPRVDMPSGLSDSEKRAFMLGVAAGSALSQPSAGTAEPTAGVDGREPVAWMHVQGNHYEPSLFELDDDEKSRGWTQFPLYGPASAGTAGVVEQASLLRQLAACKSNDPNKGRSNAGRWATVNVPTELWQQVLALAPSPCAEGERGTANQEGGNDGR